MRVVTVHNALADSVIHQNITHSRIWRQMCVIHNVLVMFKDRWLWDYVHTTHSYRELGIAWGDGEVGVSCEWRYVQYVYEIK